MVFLYSVVLTSWADSLHFCRLWLWMSDCSLSLCISEYPSKWCTLVSALFGCYMAGATWNCCCLSMHSLYAIQPCMSLQCRLLQSHIRMVHVCLAVTSHLHFWQNDQDLLCATAETQGWNGHQNKSQYKKLTQEKKILLLLLPGFKPATFQSWVWDSTVELHPRSCFLWLLEPISNSKWVMLAAVKWGPRKSAKTTPELQLAETCALVSTLPRWKVVRQVRWCFHFDMMWSNLLVQVTNRT